MWLREVFRDELMPSAIDQLKQAVAALPREAGADLRMQDLLDPALAALPELLKDQDAWKSIYIDYEPPFLMRIYLPITAGERTAYLSLHYFFGTPEKGAISIPNPYDVKPELIGKESANNYHPHPWASAFHLFDGSYKQQIGLASELGYTPENPPTPFETREQNANDNARYAFNDPKLWHRVLPNDGAPVTTMMITYMPENWNQVGPKPATKQRELTDDERAFMFQHFQSVLKSAPQKNPASIKKLKLR